jgi:glycosyltransferase involved in cell wall biosynthesis
MQSGAMGLPSIVTDINGCNEIIEHTKNGFIIPVKNQKALFESMLNCIQNKEQFSQMQQNARAMIVSRFDQQFMWESILQEYRSFDSK